MSKTEVEIYDEIQSIEQFEEMIEVAEELRCLLQEYIRKVRKNKEELAKIKEVISEFEVTYLKI